MSSTTSPKITRPIIRDEIVPSKADIECPVPQENELYFEKAQDSRSPNKSLRHKLISRISESTLPCKQDIEVCRKRKNKQTGAIQAPLTPENCLYDRKTETPTKLVGSVSPRPRVAEEDQTQKSCKSPETPNRYSDDVRTCQKIESPMKSEATQLSADKEVFHTPMFSPIVVRTPKSRNGEILKLTQKQDAKIRRTPENAEVNVSMSRELAKKDESNEHLKVINRVPDMMIKHGNSEDDERSFLQVISKMFTELRFYIFITMLVLLISYTIALWNRESICNAIRTDENEYFVYNE